MSVKKSVNALENFKSYVGCFLRNGKLIPAYGSEIMCDDFPSGVTFTAHPKLISGCLFGTDSELHISGDLKHFQKITSVNGGVTPFMAEYSRFFEAFVTVIWGDKAVHIINGKLAETEELPYSLSCAVVHCGRLFGADSERKFILRWSKADNFQDNSEELHLSGNVTLSPERGGILNLLVFKGKIVAVREYGLTVLSALSSPENFGFDFTDTDCDKIYKNTARIVGNKLYFYSVSGLKYFDGSKISAVESQHAVSAPVAACEYAGKYYVAGTCAKLNRRVILCVNLSDGESCIIDVPAETLLAKEGVYYSHGSTFNKIIEGTKYSFESGSIDFGTGKLKTVTQIDVQGKADLRISNGVCTRIFTGACGIVRPHLRGRSFTITVDGEEQLNAVTVTAEVTDEI